MQIWRSLAEVPTDLGRTVATIGNFDGVHRGHQHVLRRAREVAHGLGDLPVVVVTFDPHPVAVLRPHLAPAMLTTMEGRAALLAEAGADDLLVVPFDREVAAWSPERFVTDVLVDALHVRAVVVGANFRFGTRASGDVATLVRLGREHGFSAEGIALDGGPQVWSSTYIRAALASGDVEAATQALGHPFAVRGEVVKGDQRGRQLGYPTANVPTSAMRPVPADGVYAGRLRRLDVPGPALPAAISVGTNPTFDGERERRVEAYVLDRDDLELYGVEVEVSFVAHIRGMLRFDSVDELIETMRHDVARTRELLGT
ncbi:MAG: riboflavin kinase / adenylyltransferase [Nocardioidaceae bacterium]|nr:riboflavin kinase / adenylyltransferase [Nocardioidaceae bacterium]